MHLLVLLCEMLNLCVMICLWQMWFIWTVVSMWLWWWVQYTFCPEGWKWTTAATMAYKLLEYYFLQQLAQGTPVTWTSCAYLIFLWPCIMNWLFVNHQLDALIIIYSENIILLYMFRASSARLQEDTVVYVQPMVLLLSMRVSVGLSVHSLSCVLTGQQELA